YCLEWSPQQMVFSVNENVHYTYSPNVQNSDTWPFDSEQYMLLNIAIEPSVTSSFIESEMEIDYVRVYEASPLSTQTQKGPVYFNVLQNYPNPFNPVTTLRYDLPENGHVNITIYDMLGRQVNTLINQTQDAGYKSVIWDATNDYGKPVSAGIYLYQIQAGGYISTKKMVLLK
ncbi:MAG: T9SS type A sorting domain-containing protein, partial [Candidatus Marinimicrobia bacterium]|nr:T9SS type A sorting domain-containing protein [Candidatus Neomarinimicrobiota bacterium]